MLHLLRLLFLIVLWSPVVDVVQAQDASFEPLIMQIGDTLLRWTPDGGEEFIVSLPPGFRSQPNSSAALLGQIPAGERFTVLDGPICANSIAWWVVRFDGLEGWTAEGADGDYWLAPERDLSGG